MLEFIQIIVIAVVQGIGEFLPISSSSHIAITNTLFGLSGHPLANNNSELMKLEVCLHLGTFITVVTVLRKYIIDMLLHNPRLLCQLIVATIPAVIVFLTVKKSLPGITENYYLMSAGFIFTGIILLTTLKAPDGKNGGNTEGLKTHSNLSWTDAVLIGCMQAAAIFPGVSRFGSTMFAGLFRRLQWRESIIFSFMLSLPVVAGSGLLEIKHLLKEAPQTEPALSGIQLGLGLLVSCAVGFLALLWLLYKFPKGKLWYFSIWVFLMAPFTLWLAVQPADNEKQETKNVQQFSFSSPRFPQPVSELDQVPKRHGIEIGDMKKERERIIAEEKAKEEKEIEEEKKLVPDIENSDKLIRLVPDELLWITPDKKSVVFIGRVVLREGLLELLACRTGTKEHESILSVRVKPYMIHAALLLINAKQGKPMLADPWTPATGGRIAIQLQYRDGQKSLISKSAQDWVWDAANSKEQAKKTMSTYWVFSGSTEYNDDDGKTHYVANESGELIGLSNFVGSILDIPVQSSADNTKLQFACFTEHIPPLGTPVTVIMTTVTSTDR